MTKPLVIEYYSDILCVWAWIAQRRIDELNATLADKIDIRYHYLDVFGDAVNKIPTQWGEKGGFSGFAKHVHDSASPYPDAPINADIWKATRPTSSASSHLILKGVELALGVKASIELALVIRKAFFIEAKDISQMDVLLRLVDEAGYDSEKVNDTVKNGRALAALMADYQQAKAQSLKGSPTYIIDNGRQVLYGNVGYRILLANIEEQLKAPMNEASWC